MPKLFSTYWNDQNDALCAERNIVFFSSSKSPDQRGGSAREDEEQAEVKVEGSSGKGGDDVMENISRITAVTSEKAHSILDVWEYKFPADIDPDRIKEARKAVDEYYPKLKKLEESVDGFVNELIAEMEPIEGSMPAAPDELWKGVYEAVPEFTQAELRSKEAYNPSAMHSQLAPNIIKQNIIATWRKYSQKQPSPSVINAYAEKLSKTVAEIAKYEFEMLKTVDQVREVLWDMNEKLQKKTLEERLIRAASNDAGIPLREGQELQGFGRRLKPGFETDKPFIEKFTKRWIIKEVYVDKRMAPDPDDKKNKEKPMLMSGVWVALEEKGSGRVHRMSTNRLRDFIGVHEIVPAVYRQRNLKENVLHLNEMGIDIKAGSVLEYDEIKIDPKTNRPFPDNKKVKVLSIDDSGVKLDKPVLCRAFYENPDEGDNEYKSDLTLGEFARWMNRYRPVPVMRLNKLLEKLEEHYEYMNNRYKRNKNCHAKIGLYTGEILHADAPGNPLFEVESVDELKGIIKLKKSKTFTFAQFIRWVYENDIEPYDPGLEAEKVKTYFKAGDKTIEKTKKDAQDTIDHFQKTGLWRDTLKKLRESGQPNIAGPQVDIRGDSSIMQERQSHSMIAQFIRQTQWLRLDDIFKLFTTGWEYYTRNWQRRQKARYSSVGKNVPFFGTEFERISQNAETEEMQQFKDAMDQWGIPQIEGVMYETGNRDQLKACFNTLAPKGMLRWDDIRLYKAINKFTDINHKIPIPVGDPYKKFGPGSGKCNGVDLEGKNAMDFLADAIDSLWGESSFVGWKRQNDDTIESSISQSYRKATELENDPKNSGGIAKELSNLLTRHMNGEWVDQNEYEGLLRFCLEYGKGSGKDKAYYLLMGVNAKNKNGRSLLGWERIGHFVTKYSNQFPALDFFSSSNRDPKRDFATGEIFDTAYVRSDFDAITNKWVSEGRSNGVFKPGDDAEKFLTSQMLTSDAVQIRLEKGIRNAQNMDHDDSPYFIPALKDSEIENVCSATAGTTKKFTIQGYKNAYIGFGMRMKSLTEKYDEEKQWEDQGKQGFSAAYVQKLIVAFKAYMNYDAIMDNRYKKKKGSALQRLGSSDYQTGCVWDGKRPLRKYQDEMKGVIKEIAEAYGHGNDPNLIDLPFRKDAPESAIANFGPLFEKIIQEDDKGAKMVEIVKKHAFLYATKVGTTREEEFQLKAKMYEYDPEVAGESTAVADTPEEAYLEAA